MHFLSGLAVAIVSVASISICVKPAAAQNFDDRWTVIPKAHAEQPPENDGHVGLAPQEQSPTEKPATQQPQSRIAAEPTPDSENHPGVRPLFGKASFYSYQIGKTASGSTFDRNLPTAAHRTLPFGTRVRVTNLANDKSVVVTITDRGPKAPDRMLDLSLDAARTLEITDEGVVEVRAEVL
jgi:rare lipoprotein A (peptidoglycan hydrolase)